MFFMRADPLGGQVGGRVTGMWKHWLAEQDCWLTGFRVFGPQMALACRLDAISQGPKNSWFPGPNHLPLARIKNITHEAI